MVSTPEAIAAKEQEEQIAQFFERLEEVTLEVFNLHEFDGTRPDNEFFQQVTKVVEKLTILQQIAKKAGAPNLWAAYYQVISETTQAIVFSTAAAGRPTQENLELFYWLMGIEQGKQLPEESVVRQRYLAEANPALVTSETDLHLPQLAAVRTKLDTDALAKIRSGPFRLEQRTLWDGVNTQVLVPLDGKKIEEIVLILPSPAAFTVKGNHIPGYPEAYQALARAAKKLRVVPSSGFDPIPLEASEIQEIAAIQSSLGRETAILRTTAGTDPDIMAGYAVLSQTLDALALALRTHTELVVPADQSEMIMPKLDIASAQPLQPDVYTFYEKFRHRFAKVQEIAVKIATKQELQKTEEFLVDKVYGEIVSEIELYMGFDYLPGQASNTTESLRYDVVTHLYEFKTWLENVSNAFADDVEAASLNDEWFANHEPTADDAAAWRRFFDKYKLPVRVLEDRYYNNMLRKMEGLNPNEKFKPLLEAQKYLELEEHLKARGGDDERALATQLEHRRKLFDVSNPFSLTTRMIGDQVKMIVEGRGGGFDHFTLDYYFGEGKEKYKHAEMLVMMSKKMMQFFFEPSDPDIGQYYDADKDPSPTNTVNCKRTPAEAATVFGPTRRNFNRWRPGKTQKTIEVADVKKGQVKGKWVKGFFSYFASKWMSASFPIRNLMQERLLDELGGELTGAQKTQFDAMSAQEKQDLSRLAVELNASLDVAGIHFAMCNAVGMSPQGFSQEVRQYAADSCPLSVEMNLASRTTYPIPTVIEGYDIPEEFIQQMEYLLTQAARGPLPNKKTELELGPTARVNDLRRSIEASKALRKIWNIPHKGFVHMTDWKGKPLHKLTNTLSPDRPLLPGEKIEDRLICLPWLYQNLWTSYHGEIGAKIASSGKELVEWEQARNAATKLEHAAMQDLKFTGEKDVVIEALKTNLAEALQLVSQLKIYQVPLDFNQVGELYLRKIAYVIRYYLSLGHEPLQQAWYATEGVPNGQAESIIDNFSGFLTEQEDLSLITQLRQTILDSNWLEPGWGPRVFEHPDPKEARRLYEEEREALTAQYRDDGKTPAQIAHLLNPHHNPKAEEIGKLKLKGFLLAHMPRKTEGARLYRNLSLWFMNPSELNKGFQPLNKLRLRQRTRRAPVWKKGLNEKTLQPRPVKGQEEPAAAKH